MAKIDMDRVVMIYEDPYIYDGWSVARYEDGTFHIRWDENDYRYLPTVEYLGKIKDDEYARTAI